MCHGELNSEHLLECRASSSRWFHLFCLNRILPIEWMTQRLESKCCRPSPSSSNCSFLCEHTLAWPTERKCRRARILFVWPMWNSSRKSETKNQIANRVYKSVLKWKERLIYFAGRINGHIWQRLQFTPRRYVHDGSFASLLHIVDQHSRHHCYCPDIDVDDVPQQIGWDFSQFVWIIVHAANIVY